MTPPQQSEPRLGLLSGLLAPREKWPEWRSLSISVSESLADNWLYVHLLGRTSSDDLEDKEGGSDGAGEGKEAGCNVAWEVTETCAVERPGNASW